MKGLMEEIEADSAEAPEVSNDALAEVADLAQRQLRMLGVNEDGEHLTGLPSSSVIGDLMEWAKKQRVYYNEYVEHRLENYSMSELLAALVDKIHDIREVSEVTLPEVMKGLGGMTKFSLSSGFELEIKPGLTASILAGHEREAADWLDGRGLGDVVKDEVKVSLGRGEARLAERFMALASELGVPATEKAGVNYQTLQALVKEQLGRGVKFPEESFSVIRPAKRGK
jgi:hypothetical protein